ncbi:MAG: hypothetical protein AUJ82_03110 [Verrucomicrobia bacterium CG1_02_43_26]|nr:MAG: hypothetical protein AUJ82_03110 [Verrucomicrobia bacterium CG1_02_43_26]
MVIGLDKKTYKDVSYTIGMAAFACATLVLEATQGGVRYVQNAFGAITRRRTVTTVPVQQQQVDVPLWQREAKSEKEFL